MPPHPDPTRTPRRPRRRGTPQPYPRLQRGTPGTGVPTGPTPVPGPTRDRGARASPTTSPLTRTTSRVGRHPGSPSRRTLFTDPAGWTPRVRPVPQPPSPSRPHRRPDRPLATPASRQLAPRQLLPSAVPRQGAPCRTPVAIWPPQLLAPSRAGWAVPVRRCATPRPACSNVPGHCPEMPPPGTGRPTSSVRATGRRREHGRGRVPRPPRTTTPRRCRTPPGRTGPERPPRRPSLPPRRQRTRTLTRRTPQRSREASPVPV